MTFQTSQNDDTNRDKNSPEGLSNEICSIWQGQQDSNLRHLVLETSALPTELCPCAPVIITDDKTSEKGWLVAATRVLLYSKTCPAVESYQEDAWLTKGAAGTISPTLLRSRHWRLNCPKPRNSGWSLQPPEVPRGQLHDAVSVVKRLDCFDDARRQTASLVSTRSRAVGNTTRVRI